MTGQVRGYQDELTITVSNSANGSSRYKHLNIRNGLMAFFINHLANDFFM